MKCAKCDREALDGHLTCGVQPCSEFEAREDARLDWQMRHTPGYPQWAACCVCGRGSVNVGEGFDTCADCLSRR